MSRYRIPQEDLRIIGFLGVKALLNGPENALASLAETHGWMPLKTGWPDFFCVDTNTGEIVCIEVKPRRKRGNLGRLKRSQAIVMDALKAHGIRCYVSDGLKLEPYDRERHYGKDLQTWRHQKAA